MSESYSLSPEIRLWVEGRISQQDADRQTRTAGEILRRLAAQPGLILADEVGMGKTFVALAVAASVAQSDARRRPVVVMVPPSLKDKWPTDFELFRERCLPQAMAKRLRPATADRAVQFLKLLDDPVEQRAAIVFVTHGAFSRQLVDPWVTLTLIRQALHGRWGTQQLRQQLADVLPDILRVKTVLHGSTGMWKTLLATDPVAWLKVLKQYGVDPEFDSDQASDDDPVPAAFLDALRALRAPDTDPLFRALQGIPKRWSASWHERVTEARRKISAEARELWRLCVKRLRLRLPLLILDEAHHLKNPLTQLASLFRAEEAKADVDELARGALGGVFERMLFLTATPFQLGHDELCSVLERFGGIDWRSPRAPEGGRSEFERRIRDLRASLDAAQQAAVTLDDVWGRLRSGDLLVDGKEAPDLETWWWMARDGATVTKHTADAVRCYERCRARLQEAERLLQPWVIRHLRPRRLPSPNQDVSRRRRWIGQAICPPGDPCCQEGLAIPVPAVLPFLLAARATACAPDSRPVFAEGLASSYEAFLHTRRMHLKGAGQPSTAEAIDADDDDRDRGDGRVADAAQWYLDKLEQLIPAGDAEASLAHPKVAATVQRTTDIWRSGEKVVVFCHYVATGRTLRQRISEAIDAEINHTAARKLGCPASQAKVLLERIGRRFFDADSPLRRACDRTAGHLLDESPQLEDFRNVLVEVMRRYLRTPSFLARYLPLGEDELTAEALEAAMETADGSGLTLRELLRGFLRFLVVHCGERDRQAYIDAVAQVQTGTHVGVDVISRYSRDEADEQGASPEQLLPNVRLVNGTTRTDTRQRLMLAFNTPFYPEVLIASSVMAEGVDLHLSCRQVIHHDLCWNPTTLEQRTGRVDRIGAKAERCGQPIDVYLPFVAETQDEKMYRVVMDRERWFGVVMGEKYTPDARTAEKLAARIPLPESAASELALDLGLR